LYGGDNAPTDWRIASATIWSEGPVKLVDMLIGRKLANREGGRRRLTTMEAVAAMRLVVGRLRSGSGADDPAAAGYGRSLSAVSQLPRVAATV
jgi:hypothetical protein